MLKCFVGTTDIHASALISAQPVEFWEAQPSSAMHTWGIKKIPVMLHQKLLQGYCV